MSAQHRVSAVLICGLLAACASDYRPAVDLTGIDAAKYHRDLADCAGRAQAAYPGGAMVVGAVAGATVGAGMGSLLGSGWAGFASNAGLAESYGAIAGSVAGTAAGTVVGTRNQRAVIDDCLIRDGYKLTASGT
jgi:outer membrane lipoprotein SlyB